MWTKDRWRDCHFGPDTPKRLQGGNTLGFPQNETEAVKN